MEQFIGLDVSQELTHVCIINAKGTIDWQGKCSSTPEAIAKIIETRAPRVTRVGFETGPLSTWLWHALTDKGLPIVCLDARHAKAALKMQMNKTDKNDAYGLAQIVKTGWYREVGVKSMESHSIRAMLGARAQLVGMRIDVTNQIRGVLKTFGIILARRNGTPFEQLLREALGDNDTVLSRTIDALLSVYISLKDQIRDLERELRGYARTHVTCEQLMTIPGVGPLTAIAFVTAIDDPKRFNRSKSVGAYFGLTPRRYQSGEIDINGRISKCGDHLTRTYLFEAAGTLLTRVEKWSALKAWGLKIAKKCGMKKAKIAVVRKLTVIMHRMWMNGECFRWSTDAQAA
jgi:transposase